MFKTHTESGIIGTGLTFDAILAPSEDWQGLGFGLYGGPGLAGTPGVNFTGTMGGAILNLRLPGSGSEVSSMSGVQALIYPDYATGGGVTLGEYKGFSTTVLNNSNAIPKTAVSVGTWVDILGSDFAASDNTYTLENYYGIRLKNASAWATNHWGIYNEDRTYLADEVQVTGDLAHSGTHIGFFGATPAARAAAYTPANVTEDRSYDADITTVHELADVLGTLISDLKSYGLLE